MSLFRKSSPPVAPPPQTVLRLAPSIIEPSPHQPRRNFDEAAMVELTASIAENGILQPLTVRFVDGVYYLVAGERRLRAAMRAGLPTVPCLLLNTDDQQAALFTLLENLQRADLDFLEEALALASLSQQFQLTQAELAKRLGKSQSTIANKLRLLQLPRPLLEQGRDAGLSERHLRALLALPASHSPEKALAHIIRQQLTVAQTEAYIQSIKPLQDKPLAPSRPLIVLRDVRLFLNSIDHNLAIMKQAGFPADYKKHETEQEVFLTIRIQKPSPSPAHTSPDVSRETLAIEQTAFL